MKFNAEYPFDGYVAYLRVSTSTANIDRKIVVLYSMNKNPTRRSISYARYLLCVKEKRILEKTEHADHIDGCKTNDDINNLQILSVKGNNRKSINERGANRMMVKLECPACRKNFIIARNQSFMIKGGFYNTCSRKCGYKMLTIKTGLSENQLKIIGERQIVKYFRLKPFVDIK